MTVRDSSAIDDAIVKRLLDDAQLKSLMPDGVYWEKAAPGAKRFVVVSLVDENDIPTFDDGRAIESNLHLIKAVCLEATGARIKDAAKRIDDLLDDQPLNVIGYSLMSIYREARIRYTETDDIDAKIRWQHRGGRYRTQVTAPGA